MIGPLTRYAEDLRLMTKVMCENPNELNLDQTVRQTMKVIRFNVYI